MKCKSCIECREAEPDELEWSEVQAKCNNYMKGRCVSNGVFCTEDNCFVWMHLKIAAVKVERVDDG